MPKSERDSAKGARHAPRNKKRGKVRRMVVPRKKKRPKVTLNHAEEQQES